MVKTLGLAYGEILHTRTLRPAAFLAGLLLLVFLAQCAWL
jgi:hypothetical protein